MLLFFCYSFLFAGNERSTDVLPLSSVTAGSKLIVQDEHFGQLTLKKIKKCNIEARLEFRETSMKYYSSTWSIQVDYTITGYVKGSNTPQTKSDYLVISYNPADGTNYVDVAVNQYPNLVYAKIENISISPTGIGTPYPNDVFISLTYESEVYYPLSTSLPNVSKNFGINTNELHIKWNTIQGAESYDLEYVFVELGNESTYPVPVIAYDFRDAVRVTLNKEEYTIPMNYPKGAFVFRVRGIGVFFDQNNNPLPNKRYEGEWSYQPTVFTLAQANSDDNSTINKIAFWGASLHGEMNWQSSASFAEEGKRKDVLSFFDGSLRGRQVLTSVNSDNNAIIAETIYDYEGRPALSTLPAAVAWTGTHFYINSNGNNPFNYGYNRTDFATDVHLDYPTPTGPDAMSSNAECNEYYGTNYSLNNPYTGYTPQAGGFPFTQTVYKSDGTGRIISQSNVGDTYRFSKGRTTDYYYASPMQVEIDRLFGNEVGLRTKYKKNFVVDPNKQVSIQYLDQQGRTIATALAGATPDSLLEMDDKPAPVTLTENLLLNNNHMNQDKQMVSVSVIPVTSVTPVNYTFEYQLLPEEHCPSCWEEGCIDCYYDVFISVKDEYGKFVKESPGFTTDAEYIFTGIISKNNPKLSFILPLSMGTYTVTKILQLNKDKVEEYKQDLYEYLTANNSQTQDCFEVPEIEPEPCDCKSLCDNHYIEYSNNGDTLYFDNNGNIVQTNGTIPNDVQTLLDDCKKQCDDQAEFSDCEVRLKKMKTQISPGGQYFDNKAPHSSVQANSDWFDFYVLGTPPFSNYNNCIPNPPGNFWSGFITFLTNTPACVSPIDFSLPANQNWQTLRDNWRACYADYLVQWHPEYCAYKYFCHTCSICTDGGNPETFFVDVDVQNCATDDFLKKMYKCDSDCWAQGGGSNCCNGTSHNYNFFNPIGLSPNSTNNGLVANNTQYVSNMGGLSQFATDPLMDDCSTYDSWIADSVENKLRNFLTFDTSSTTYTHSIWYVLDNPGHANQNGTSIEKLYHKIHSSFNGTTTKYMFFRAVYHFYRSYYHYWFFKNHYEGCSSLELGGSGIYCFWDADTDNDEYIDVDDQDVDFTGFHLVFPKNKGFEDYENFSLNLIDDYKNQMCETNCEAHADSWMQQYASCTGSLTTQEKADLKNDLIAICLLGCDETNNFMGSSNGDGQNFIVTNTTPTVNAYNFDDVINAYVSNCTTTVVHPPVPPFEQGKCNCDLLIAFADPYASDPYNPNPTELVNITNALNSAFSLSLDTAMAHNWINYCRDGSGEMTLTYIQELECVECKCKNLNEYIFNVTGDEWSNLSSQQKTDFVDDFNFNLGTSYTTNNIDTWLSECAEEDPDETAFTNFPEELRCIADVAVNLEELENNKCEEENAEEAQSQIQHIIDNYVANLLAAFIDEHYTACFNTILQRESFTVEYELDEYYYTLYYYDQAGNLVKTVPPYGVKPIPPGNIPDVQDHRNDPINNIYMHTTHTMASIYHYDSRNLLRKQITPDADTSLFWYDRQGRLVASQNQKQFMAGNNIYSYTLYDNLDRVLETGEITHTAPLTDEIVLEYDNTYDNFEDWLGAVSTRTQVHKTFYDLPINQLITQQNLRNRVASATFTETYNASPTQYHHATHYSYDAHGNVKTLAHDNRYLASIAPQEKLKITSYQYDVVSGNVKQVYYQKNKNDQHIHKYEYDADNRITNVYTSTDSIIWDMDARYHYYAHGPLARIEIGEKNVQAGDYAYTLQGWLKAFNSVTLRRHRDPGKDGNNIAGNLNAQVGSDAFGFALGYHFSDYKPVNTSLYGTQTNYFLPAIAASNYYGTVNGLFNGNISRMEIGLMNNAQQSQQNMATLGKVFAYDQLNRIKSQRTWNKWNQSGSTDDIADNNSFSTATDLGEYSTDYTYDFNGNILSLNRTGHYDYSGTTLNVMDELVYSYERDPFVSGLPRNRNRLLHVEDTETNSPYSTDIQIYTPFDDNNPYSNNYNYDEIGNLIKDDAENIDEIKWTLTGKVSEIIYNNTNPTIAFKYDATGNRILKIVKHSSNQSDWEYTYYARDAQGNPMATYNISFANLGGNTYQCITKLAERHIYGSARLGLNQKETENIHKFSASINGTTGMFDFITNVAVELGPNSANQAKMFGGGSSPIALYHDTAQSYSVELYTEHPTKISSTAMAGFSISQGSGTWLATDTFLTNAEQKITIEALDTLYLFSNFEDMFGYMEYNSAKTTKIKGSSLTLGPPLLPIFAKNYYENERGNKVYELTSHLGNVHSVVADRKIPIQAGYSGNIDYYTADVVSNSDYYPFGATMPGRNFNSNSYRYGMHGMEKDDEVKGSGNWYTFGDYGYDPRIIQRPSPDKKSNQIPGVSPYAPFLGNPNVWKDPDGELPILPLLLKAGASGAADMLAQAAMAYYFDPNVESAGQAFEVVNYYQVARSSAEGLIPWRTPGGRIGRAAATASGDVLVNAFNAGSDYTQTQALQDFATGFIGDLAGGGLGELVAKYGSKGVANGLLKMGFDTKFIRETTGGLNNKEVRSWYSEQVKGININLDPTEANARMVVGQRNALKQQARDLMSDRAKAADLDITDPIQDFDYYNKKYDGDYSKIMQGGTTPNADVNKKLGVK